MKADERETMEEKYKENIQKNYLFNKPLIGFTQGILILYFTCKIILGGRHLEYCIFYLFLEMTFPMSTKS